MQKFLQKVEIQNRVSGCKCDSYEKSIPSHKMTCTKFYESMSKIQKKKKSSKGKWVSFFLGGVSTCRHMGEIFLLANITGVIIFTPHGIRELNKAFLSVSGSPLKNIPY